MDGGARGSWGREWHGPDSQLVWEGARLQGVYFADVGGQLVRDRIFGRPSHLLHGPWLGLAHDAPEHTGRARR